MALNYSEAAESALKLMGGRSRFQVVFAFLFVSVLFTAAIYAALHWSPGATSNFDTVPALRGVYPFDGLDSFPMVQRFLEILLLFLASISTVVLVYKSSFTNSDFDPRSDVYTEVRNELQKIVEWKIDFFGFFLENADKSGDLRFKVDPKSKKLIVKLVLQNDVFFSDYAKDVGLRVQEDGRLNLTLFFEGQVQTNEAPSLPFRYFVTVNGTQDGNSMNLSGEWFRLVEDHDKFNLRGRCEISGRLTA